jgi:hypothetical protein
MLMEFILKILQLFEEKSGKLPQRKCRVGLTISERKNLKRSIDTRLDKQ